MKLKKEKRFKRCPRCNLKTFNSAKVCGRCELNFDKFNFATNEEGKNAIKQGEKERVVYTSNLPTDVDKWNLFLWALLFGWAGAHLFKAGKINRGIAHFIGLICAGCYLVTFYYRVNNFWYNVGNLCGAYWAVTFVMAVFDIFQILFNKFKVPVSLPKKEDK